MHSFPQTRCGSFECGLRSQFIYVLLNSPLPPLAFFDTQNKNIFAHEIGHTLGIGHTAHTQRNNPGKVYPLDWDCGNYGTIVGGNSRMEWSACAVMDMRKWYTTESEDNWCLPGNS